MKAKRDEPSSVLDLWNAIIVLAQTWLSSNVCTCEILEGDKLDNVYRRDNAAKNCNDGVIPVADNIVSPPVCIVFSQDIVFPPGATSHRRLVVLLSPPPQCPGSSWIFMTSQTHSLHSFVIR